MRSEKQTKVVEPEVIDQAIDCSMGLPTLSKSFYMVQARKETPDHVSVREKCLNHSRPNGVSVVGINKAILISSMTLRGETPPKSSSIGGRKISPQSYLKLSPIYYVKHLCAYECFI